MVKAPPRTGKTHTIVMWMKQTGSANYFTHRHAIIEHAIKIAREIRMELAVWVVGLQQAGACRTGTRICATCPLKPGQDNFTTMQIEARKLLWKKKNTHRRRRADQTLPILHTEARRACGEVLLHRGK